MQNTFNGRIRIERDTSSIVFGQKYPSKVVKTLDMKCSNRVCNNPQKQCNNYSYFDGISSNIFSPAPNLKIDTIHRLKSLIEISNWS